MAFIEASYRLPSPSGAVMLYDTSTQNSMFVRTRRVLGALSCCGPGQQHDHDGEDEGRQRLGQLEQRPPSPGPSAWRAVVERQRRRRPPERFQTQASSKSGTTSKASTKG